MRDRPVIALGPSKMQPAAASPRKRIQRQNEQLDAPKDRTQLPQVNPRLLDRISDQLLERTKQLGLFDEIRMSLASRLETRQEFKELERRFEGQVDEFCKRHANFNEPRSNLRQQLSEFVESNSALNSSLQKNISYIVQRHRRELMRQYKETARQFLSTFAQPPAESPPPAPPKTPPLPIEAQEREGAKFLATSFDIATGQCGEAAPSQSPPPPRDLKEVCKLRSVDAFKEPPELDQIPLPLGDELLEKVAPDEIKISSEPLADCTSSSSPPVSCSKSLDSGFSSTPSTLQTPPPSNTRAQATPSPPTATPTEVERRHRRVHCHSFEDQIDFSVYGRLLPSASHKSTTIALALSKPEREPVKCSLARTPLRLPTPSHRSPSRGPDEIRTQNGKRKKKSKKNRWGRGFLGSHGDDRDSRFASRRPSRSRDDSPEEILRGPRTPPLPPPSLQPPKQAPRLPSLEPKQQQLPLLAQAKTQTSPTRTNDCMSGWPKIHESPRRRQQARYRPGQAVSPPPRKPRIRSRSPDRTRLSSPKGRRRRDESLINRKSAHHDNRQTRTQDHQTKEHRKAHSRVRDSVGAAKQKEREIPKSHNRRSHGRASERDMRRRRRLS